MRVQSPQLEIRDGHAWLSAVVEIGGELRTWWIAVPAGFGPQVDTVGTAFLPAATLVAAAAGEDLEMLSPVSPVQLAGARRAAALYSEWWDWRCPAVSASAQPLPYQQGRDAALLFTRGIDSTASLIGALDHGDPDANILIGIDGLEPRHSPDIAEAVMQDSAEVAATVGMPFVRVSTNLRTETDRYTAWGAHAHGAVLLGCSLVLAPMLRRIWISPTVKNPMDLHHGSTPELDACWSTECTAICTTSVALDRVDRAAIVGTRPDLARRIKVCWEGDQRGNCGRCSKCLHTMTALAMTGSGEVLEAAFEAPLSSDAIRSARTAPAAALADVLNRLTDCDPDIAEAWHDMANRATWGNLAGLAGFNPDPGLTIGDGAHAGAPRIGWGEDTRVPVLPPEAIHACVGQRRPGSRVIPWAMVQRQSPECVALGLALAESWPRGTVMLTDVGVPGPPPLAVRRVLENTSLRVWYSTVPYLDGIALAESVMHGCVPLQVMALDVVTAFRSALPPRAQQLVWSLDDIALGMPAPAVLDELWQAACDLLGSASGLRMAAQ